MGPTSNTCTGNNMDGEAILAALDVGPNALATAVPSLGKRLKLFRLMQQEKGVGIVISLFVLLISPPPPSPCLPSLSLSLSGVNTVVLNGGYSA